MIGLQNSVRGPKLGITMSRQTRRSLEACTRMGSWTSKLVFLFAGIVAATAFHILPDSTPRSDFKFEVRRANEGSFEVDLWNAGSGEYRSTVGISVSWHTARLVACDGL